MEVKVGIGQPAFFEAGKLSLDQVGDEARGDVPCKGWQNGRTYQENKGHFSLNASEIILSLGAAKK
jgi:hypothetical protein